MSEQRPLAPEIQRFVTKSEGIQNERKFTLDEIRQNLEPDFVHIANEIVQITGRWNPVVMYTAAESELDKDNPESERNKFIDAFKRGERINPHLTYPDAEDFELGDAPDKLYALLSEVRNIKISRDVTNRAARINRLARAALYFKIKDDLATVDFIEGIYLTPLSRQ